MLSKRHVLAGGMIAALAFASGRADAILFSGGGSVAPGGQLTSLTLTNTSGSTQAANFITPMFGHGFKKGDIPSGTAPIFKTVGGTVIAYSMSTNTVTWSDGSLKFAAFALLYPSSIAGSATATVNVFSGGTTPAASSRTTADFAAGSLDLTISATGLDNLSGVWTANLNQGISALGPDYIYMDGSAGKVWRIPANFRQSAADHGQLMCWWYVWAMQDNAGNLAGVRYLGRITQPWYNKTSPYPDFISFSSVLVKNGVTTLKDIWANVNSAQTFTNPGGVYACNTSAPNGFESGYLARFTSSGTLPSPLQTNTPYWLASGPDTGLTTSQFIIGNNSYPKDAGQIQPTNAGSGTHTVTVYPYVTLFGSLYTADTKGRWEFIQGGGSLASDATVRVTQSNTYLRSTQLIPPYDFTTYGPYVSSNSSYTFKPMSFGPINRSFDQTGEQPQIGPHTAYTVRLLFTGAEVDETITRFIGLCIGNFPICLRDTATKTIPCGNNGHNNSGSTYTGMPAPNRFFRWGGVADGNQAGPTTPGCQPTASASAGVMTVSSIPAGQKIYPGSASTIISQSTTVLSQLSGTTGGAGTYQLSNSASWGSQVVTVTSPASCAGGGGVDTTHLPNFQGLAYLMFGEPQYMDMMTDLGNSAVIGRYTGSGTAQVSTTLGGTNNVNFTRNGIINGTTYAGIIINGGDLLRNDAWALRDLSSAAGLLPDVHPEAAGIKTYFKDMTSDSITAINAFVTLEGTTWATTNGVWNETSATEGGVSKSWASGYYINSICQLYRFTENAGALSFINYLMKWPAHINTIWGIGYLNYYQAVIRLSPNAGDGTTPYVNSDANVGFQGWGASWSNGTKTFTELTKPAGSTTANGDQRLWNTNEGPIPAAFNAEQTYYVVNSGVGTYELSATLGGASIQSSDTSSNTAAMYGWSASIVQPLAVNAVTIGGDGQGYLANVTSAIYHAKALGATVDSTLMTNLTNQFQAQSSYLSLIGGNPVYPFGTSF